MREKYSEELFDFLMKQNHSINGVNFFSQPRRAVFYGHQTMDAMLETNPANEFALREKAMLYLIGSS